MLPTMIVLEPLSECLVLGACASWAASVLFEWDSLVFYLVHILLWFMFDWTLLSVVQNGPLPFNKLEFVCGWLLSEITRPYLFLQAVLDPLIQWRSRVYKLRWGGVAEEVKAKVKYWNIVKNTFLIFFFSLFLFSFSSFFPCFLYVYTFIYRSTSTSNYTRGCFVISDILCYYAYSTYYVRMRKKYMSYTQEMY